MQILLNKLEKIGEDLRDKIDDRVALFDKRSERWQNSERGEAYQENTDALEDIMLDLENLIDNLNQLD